MVFKNEFILKSFILN